VSGGLWKNGDRAHQTKAVGLGVLLCEVRDVSVNRPPSDDTQREQLLGDTQYRQDVRAGETPPDDDFLEQTLPRVVKSGNCT